jgi:hypothetical protein
LLVVGLNEGQQPKINGEPVAVTEDGILIDSGHLALPGVHIVELGSVSRRIEIIEPTIKLNPEAIHNKSAHMGATIALPKGSWTVIGATPGEVKQIVCNSQQGTIIQCSFQAVWAIDVGPKSGATVLSLTKMLSRPQSAKGSKNITQKLSNQENWISVIYNAAIRRPCLGTIHDEDNDNRLVEVWKAYVQMARQLKRLYKRRRK